MKNMNRILVLSPHTDDGALGCGATITKFIEEGKNVAYVSFSAWDKLMPKKTQKNILKQELEEVAKILNLPRQNLIMYDFEVRNFSANRQKILEELIKLKKRLDPDAVLLPSLNDLHQDHRTIAQEGLRAFKKATIFGYEEPWNHITFNTVGFIAVGNRHLQKKLEAIKCFQAHKDKPFMNQEFFKSLATVRGNQIDAKYAEAFEVIRWIGDC